MAKTTIAASISGGQKKKRKIGEKSNEKTCCGSCSVAVAAAQVLQVDRWRERVRERERE